MVQLQPSGPDLLKPKPKYGHLSDIDPEFAPLKELADQNFAALWALPLEEFKATWLSAPVPLPSNAPVPGTDYLVSDRTVPVRDGTEIGIRVYKPMSAKNSVTRTVLVLKAHGGGETNPLLTFRV
jgi:hypothetical protein